MDLPRLIEALSDPKAYPYPVREVEVRQTHISVVFLAGDFAYKLKKPVNPGFLDFSTLEKRRHFCAEEIRLNRRLAPQVYLGVVPIVAAPAGGARFAGAGPAIEWAVKMQRLPESATFRERLRRAEIGAEAVKVLARRLAAFHKTAETNEHIAAFGRFEAVTRIILDIFAEAAPQVGTTVNPVVFERDLSLAKERLERLRPLIEERARRGVTRDTHGDLHLDHVYFFPERKHPDDLVIIDCIEFNERFRFTDPVADMAFAAMDFVFCGRRDLARLFAETYFEASGDEEGKPLLPLYTAYRTTVRGLVDGLKLDEPEVPAAEKVAALAKARAHWLLALAELEKPERKPCLLLIAGLPGSGKSVLARALAERAGFSVIRSDVVRKQLAAWPLGSAAPGSEALYTPEWTQRTYEECARQAEQLIFEGKRVLVDATFREESKRLLLLETAARSGVPAAILVCRAEPQTIRKRLAERRGDVSDADWSVYLHMAATWEQATPRTHGFLHYVSTDRSEEQTLSRALQCLRELDLVT